MRRFYIWQQPDWPGLHYRAAELLQPLGLARRQQGELSAGMAQIGLEQRNDASLDTLTTDAIETSEIEGEHIDYAAVRSSVALHLGMPEAAIAPADARAAGVAAMTVDATRNYAEPLTAARLFAWHSGLFPNGRSDGRRIAVGRWRSGPIGVYSRNRKDGSPITHFIAPPADRLEHEMSRFLEWFSVRSDDGLVRSALAHLWFVTVHPFEDGNGRIARAIADMALAQDDESPQRFFSMSKQIRAQLKAYYEMLERAQSGTTDVTDWIVWFLQAYANAIGTVNLTLDHVLRANRFWSAHSHVVFNERQKKMLTLVFHGYEGKLNTRNWARLAGTSKDTALRDLSDLVTKGILRSEGAGRSAHYQLPE